MSTEARKAAVSAYKKRRAEAGIYAVRCGGSGEIWAGSAPDLAAIQNRLWFTLRSGTHTHRSLQSAWNRCGASAFAFEIIERLDEEASAYVRDRVMTERLIHWADRLGAARI